jgi:hypothetical protein
VEKLIGASKGKSVSMFRVNVMIEDERDNLHKTRRAEASLRHLHPEESKAKLSLLN